MCSENVYSFYGDVACMLLTKLLYDFLLYINIYVCVCVRARVRVCYRVHLFFNIVIYLVMCLYLRKYPINNDAAQREVVVFD
jgi:hypothetical protein